MEPVDLTVGTPHQDDAEHPAGMLSVVLSAAGSDDPVPLGPHGPTLVTTLEDARFVLTDTDAFELPFDVSRRRFRRAVGPGKHTPPLSARAVAAGTLVLEDELATTSVSLPPEVDTLAFLRSPVARSTTAALVPEATPEAREVIAGLVLDWIDALAPVIRATRPPRWFSRRRRTEQRASRRLVAALAAQGCARPDARATALAAGVQVPIAAGAWCLTEMACHPGLQDALRSDPALASSVVWECLRLHPPSWLLPRITARPVVLGRTPLLAYEAVVVSPLLLGRDPTLAPGPEAGHAPLDELDPQRWAGPARPGAWLPFGAGPHACPGRNLGLAQLACLVRWAAELDLTMAHPPGTDTSRGLSPSPSRITVARHADGNGSCPGDGQP